MPRSCSRLMVANPGEGLAGVLKAADLGGGSCRHATQVAAALQGRDLASWAVS
jgi:hypothetical protein